MPLPRLVARRIAPAEYPGQQLPVAASPAVLTRGGHVVARREFLDDFDVGDQSGPGEGALEEVVAEKCSLGHAIGERRLEGIDVIDAFAGIGAQPEEILVHVGDGGRIRIDAARAGEHALKERAFAARRQRRRDPRLQHRVALEHLTARRIEPGPVQRMSHLADQTPHRISRQPGIRIERDDVPDIGWDDRRRPPTSTKVVSGAPRSSWFNSWSLPRLRSQPIHCFCPLAPDPPPMEQHEAVARGGGAVQTIQARDAFAAMSSSAASPAVCSAGASVQSESNAKCSSPSGEAR